MDPEHERRSRLVCVHARACVQCTVPLTVHALRVHEAQEAGKEAEHQQQRHVSVSPLYTCPCACPPLISRARLLHRDIVAESTQSKAERKGQRSGVSAGVRSAQPGSGPSSALLPLQTGPVSGSVLV